VGDYLSYYQDAIATEAYLGTARQRVSVRRHARLLDYAMHDGCNARVWVQVRVTTDAPAGGIILYPLLVKDSTGSWTPADSEPTPEIGLETLRTRFVTKVSDSTVLSDADFDKLVTSSTAEVFAFDNTLLQPQRYWFLYLERRRLLPSERGDQGHAGKALSRPGSWRRTYL
jgi:hypothetical protein